LCHRKSFAARFARDHELLDLYDTLPESRRIEPCKIAERFAHEHAVKRDEPFRELTATIKTAFVHWRYAYEFERTGLVKPQPTIPIMRTCH